MSPACLWVATVIFDTMERPNASLVCVLAGSRQEAIATIRAERPGAAAIVALNPSERRLIKVSHRCYSPSAIAAMAQGDRPTDWKCDITMRRIVDAYRQKALRDVSPPEAELRPRGGGAPLRP